MSTPPGPTSTAHRRLRRARATTSRRWRSALAVLRAATDPDRATFAHLVVTRRCNLACGYCNEYDHTSSPVDLDQLLDRVDELARLGTAVVALSGGEPLLQPGATAVIRRIREHGMMAGLITNGYPLTPRRIASLNAAGLDFMQISIDNVDPDTVSAKSLSVLDRHLRWLRDGAEFDVTINTVLGSGVPRPQDALTIVERARSLGFSTTLGVIHDSDGQLRALDPAESAVYQQISRRNRRIGSVLRNVYTGFSAFQDNLAAGRPNEWKCRAGARYIYVDEAGIVRRCSQTRTAPGVALREYSVNHLRAEFDTPKPCAPYCTIGCVHRMAVLDRFRSQG